MSVYETSINIWNSFCQKTDYVKRLPQTKSFDQSFSWQGYLWSTYPHTRSHHISTGIEGVGLNLQSIVLSGRSTQVSLGLCTGWDLDQSQFFQLDLVELKMNIYYVANSWLVLWFTHRLKICFIICQSHWHKLYSPFESPTIYGSFGYHF